MNFDDNFIPLPLEIWLISGHRTNKLPPWCCECYVHGKKGLGKESSFMENCDVGIVSVAGQNKGVLVEMFNQDLLNLFN